MTEFEEMQAAVKALTAEMGAKGSVTFSVGTREVHLSAWPKGILGKEYVSSAPGLTDWREMFADVRAKWAGRAEAHEANMIRDLALAIVRITYETGGCTDAQLRADFDAADVVRYGEQAVERANAMAERGPFSIIPTVGANVQAAA